MPIDKGLSENTMGYTKNFGKHKTTIIKIYAERY